MDSGSRRSRSARSLGVAAQERIPGAEAGFQAFQRELDYGGGLLAGGLAYRLFLWLLPIGLVGAQILGYWVDTDEESVEGAARHFGIGAAAIASAGRGRSNEPGEPRLAARLRAGPPRVVLAGLRPRARDRLLPRVGAAAAKDPPAAACDRVLQRRRPRRRGRDVRARLAARRARAPRDPRRDRHRRLPGGDDADRDVVPPAPGPALARADPGRAARRRRLPGDRGRSRLLLRAEDRPLVGAVRHARRCLRAPRLALRACAADHERRVPQRDALGAPPRRLRRRRNSRRRRRPSGRGSSPRRARPGSTRPRQRRAARPGGRPACAPGTT